MSTGFHHVSQLSIVATQLLLRRARNPSHRPRRRWYLPTASRSNMTDSTSHKNSRLWGGACSVCTALKTTSRDFHRVSDFSKPSMFACQHC